MAKNPSELRIAWSKRENDFVVYYDAKPNGGWFLDRIIGKRTETLLKSSAAGDPAWQLDGAFDCNWNPNIGVFRVDFIKEMEARGYDPRTLRVSVRRKENS